MARALLFESGQKEEKNLRSVSGVHPLAVEICLDMVTKERDRLIPLLAEAIDELVAEKMKNK